MYLIKVVKILRRYIHFFPLDLKKATEVSESDSFLKIKYAKMGKQINPYCLLKSQEHEEEQYETLLRDFGISGRILFDKVIAPAEFSLGDLYSEILKQTTKKNFYCLILDISEFHPPAIFPPLSPTETFLDFFSLYGLFYKTTVNSVLIITKTKDRAFLEKFNKEPWLTFFKEIKKLRKKFYIITEEADIFSNNGKFRRANKFLYEHLKYIIRKPENKFYGHLKVSSGTHTHIQVFQYFDKLVEDYKDVFFNYFQNLLKKKGYDTLITFAYPENPFRELGGRLEQSLGISHIGLRPALDIKGEIKKKEIRNVLLLTDAIYSGNTARKIISFLKDNNIEISLIALTADKTKLLPEFENVKLDILVFADLPWWEDEGKCPLCKFSVPSIGQKAGIEDRYKVRSELTPYEFYDFIKKSNALDTKIKIMLNRNSYRFFFEIHKIVYKFGIQIARMLLGKLEQYTKIENIDVIICPEDENKSAILLSISLLEVIKRIIPVVCIRREHIKAWTDLNKYRDATDYYRKLISEKKVLIVDDGINTSVTIMHLKRLCESMRAKAVIGSIVFLNRCLPLKAEQLEMEGGIWWLYHWPSPPFRKDEFPYLAEDKEK